MATALDSQAEKLSRIHTIPALVKYLKEELDWPVDVDDWEDAVYDWQPEELNLKPEHHVAINSIKQLKPLVSHQPWGIFFVDFDKGKLPIVVLRRMLNGLAIKSRVKGSGHQTWMARDLLFVSSFGEAKSREIALAHFTDESDMGDLPTLRVLGWDEADTALQLGHVARTLREKLRWPAHTASKADQDAWREQWASAFTLKYRQVINDSKTLALALAVLAKRIRIRVNTVLELENDKGHLRQLHKAFKDNLIGDLTHDGFADMYAQTITYGLFAARASRGSGALVADDAAHMAPSTNPFLRDLLQDFLHAGGRAKRHDRRVDFDELGINEVVTTLRDVPMEDILRSFGAARPGDDPVIHFYEDFLKAYDKKMRAKRGVFYTPSPVVQFIVRSVDEILKTEFGIEDGLASTLTWGEMIARKPGLKLPKFCTEHTPFVQILDPATGTGTFIVEVITQVHAHMLAKWAKLGKVTKAQWQPLWIEYVKTHLLPRLYAFELMMAPYAIAHMKIGLKLFDTGYTFPEDGPRVNVFLTNALEPAHEVNPELAFEAPMLAHEAAAANRVKEQLAATVILGNPPYSLVSSNMEPSQRLLVDRYKYIGEQRLRERGALQLEKILNDDYVKFIAKSQDHLSLTAVGVLGLITNHAYLDNPTMRGLRYNLISSFEQLQLYDLGGSAKKSDGDLDENVFDIQQGVGIFLGTKWPESRRTQRHAVISGARADKYSKLSESKAGDVAWTTLAPAAPHFLFVPTNYSLQSEYDKFAQLADIFAVHSIGCFTSKDHFVISRDLNQVVANAKAFRDSRLSDAELCKSLELNVKDAWDVERSRKYIQELSDKEIVTLTRKFTHRPFDEKYIFFHKSLVWSMAEPVNKNLQIPGNIALVTSRQLATPPWNHIFCSSGIVEMFLMSNKTKEGNHVFPLYLMTGTSSAANVEGEAGKITNISKIFLEQVSNSIVSGGDLSPEAVFHYIYSVLHSSAYRNRYSEFLKIDFPRIPIPDSREVFDSLAKLGAELVAWHLLEHPDAAKIVAGSARPAGAVAWFGSDFSLQKVGEKGKSLAEVSGDAGKVYVNATSGFANVHQSVWQHTIGGYQVLHKWLDDRRKARRSLSPDDITHWLRVYAALQATQKLMLQVDEAIEAHGGWPGAFSQNHPPPDAAKLASEQIAQKAQLKAQKKAAKASKTIANSDQGTLGLGLFDPDSDLDALAAASGAPPRPKSRATPAQAAGGKASTSPAKADDITDGQAMCAIRAVLARAGASAITRPDLIRATARELGFARTTPRLSEVLDTAIRRAVRRGIAENNKGELTLVSRTIEGYDRGFLKRHLQGVITGSWCDRAEVSVRFARALGFARTGPKIEAVVESLVRSCLRAGDIEAIGRGDLRQVRKTHSRKGDPT